LFAEMLHHWCFAEFVTVGKTRTSCMKI